MPQRWWWRIEQSGRAILVVLVGVALTGLAGGGGPLSRGHITAGDASMDYPRIARRHAAESATIFFAPGTTGLVDVHLSDDFLTAFTIDHITPAPYSITSTPEGQTLTFELSGGTSINPGSSSDVSKATLSLRPPRSILFRRARIRIGTARPVEPGFMVLP